MGMDRAEGTRTKTERSPPPYSSSSTECRLSSVSRFGSTHPADPAPTIT